jgi:hypothetical protein
MTDLGFVVCVATSIGVLVDAESIGVKKGQIQGMFDLGPGGWCLATFLLGIVILPAYLSKREEYKRVTARERSDQARRDMAAARIRAGASRPTRAALTSR